MAKLLQIAYLSFNNEKIVINVFIILSYILSTMSFIPSLKITHWSFRMFDYIRIQLTILQVFVFILGFFLFNQINTPILISQVILFGSIIYQLTIIFPYLPFFNSTKKQEIKSNTISLISVNVLQKNKNYKKLIDQVKQIKPDILLTMETNILWENALKEIEEEYEFCYKIPKENRYGMHFYTNLKVKEVKEHYFISENRPAIEVYLSDNKNNDFVFWGIHPPPPSPTEKATSKQKDGELMQVAKLIRELDLPNLVAGDFNNVSWSNSAKLFSKISELEDARIGRGIYGSFPTLPPILRFPLDLLFNSKEITINVIKILPDIGSDHLPIFSTFTITKSKKAPKKKLDSDIKEEADKIIEEGKEAKIKEEDD